MVRSRQLAAIMFTDIQGYTALMQQNESEAIRVRNRHRQVFNSMTEKHNGKILQYYGDGTLSIFDSAIEAVECGIEMQLEFQKDLAIPVRIGIHTGDIIFSNEEIIGDGVNVASRIESLSVPGSVFISEKVYDEIKNQKSIKTSMLKTFRLKNIEKPIQVYAISNEGLIVPEAEDIVGKTELDPESVESEQAVRELNVRKRTALWIAIPVIVAGLLLFYLKFGLDSGPSEVQEMSIAVLAFENMSGDPDQEYFSDGISEEVLNSLANIDGLKVAGRTSAFSFKGKNEDLRSIGEKLNVKMVLEGSVRKAGNQVRITAQLINVEDGFHLWSETYDREMEDVLSIQEEIADHIVENLKLQVHRSVSSKSQPRNVEAYELFLKGSYFFNRDWEGKMKALDLFKRAVELDPEYAEAYAMLGDTYLQHAGFRMSATEAYSRARVAAQRAISLNQYEPRAHKVLAYIHLFYDWDWEATLTEYNKAIDYGLSENNEFITYYDIFVNADYENAIRVSKQILETDPFRVESHWQLGLCYYFAGRFEEALVKFDDAVELNSTYIEGIHWKGVALYSLGRFDEALVELDKGSELANGLQIADLEKLIVKARQGQKEEVLQLFKPEEFIDPMDVARLYIELGMHDEAIYWLEEGYKDRSVMMITLKHLWEWDPLRDDPRFIEIYNRMNFSD